MHSLRRMFAAMALALVLAPLVANAPLFDPDEGLHAAIAQEMVLRGDYVTPTFLGAPFLDKPILFFWAEALSLRLFGDHEFAVRIPPLLFGLAGMLSVAWLGGALFGAAAGLIAGIAYGTMLLPLGVSQVAVHDIGLVPFMCVACWCLARLVSPAPWSRVVALAALAGLALGLSILTKGLVGCVFTGIFAGCLAIRTPAAIPRLVAALCLAGVVALVVAAPWYVGMEHAHPGYLHYYFVERHLQGYLTATQRHAGRPWWYYLPIVIGGALPWTAYLALDARTVRADSLRLAVWAWFAVGLVFLSIGESKLVTYVLPLFPILALLIGDTLAKRASAPASDDRGVLAAMAAQATCLMVVPAGALIALQMKYGASHPLLWPAVGACGLGVLYATRRAVHARVEHGFVCWMSGATIASLIGMMIVLPHVAAWMTSRDLAAALNAGETLPSRVTVIDERIGSLVFYLSPALRAQATSARVAESSFSEAIARIRVDADDAVVAMRVGQRDRVRRLFPALPEPDQQAGTFLVYRNGRLRQALAAR